jgi:hypothetical protein
LAHDAATALPPASKKARTKSKRIQASTVSISSHLKVTATLVIDSLTVAEVKSETPYVDIGPAQLPSTGSLQHVSIEKKVPFVKLSEPARVAVSFFSLTFCECESYSTGGRRPERANLGIVFAADSHGQLVQVTQEIAAECPVSGLGEVVTSQTSGEITTDALIAVMVFISQLYKNTLGSLTYKLAASHL